MKTELKKHKPEGTMISKEELIEKCKGKVFKCESQEEWDLCVEKCKMLNIKECAKGDSFKRYNHGYGDSFDLTGGFGFGVYTYDESKIGNLSVRKKEILTAQDFLSYVTPSVTVENGVTAIDNPSVAPHTGFNRLDKILDNIESLKKQKDVINDRRMKHDSMLVLWYDTEIIVEYVIDNDQFHFSDNITTENIRYVKDWLNGLLDSNTTTEEGGDR